LKNNGNGTCNGVTVYRKIRNGTKTVQTKSNLNEPGNRTKTAIPEDQAGANTGNRDEIKTVTSIKTEFTNPQNSNGKRKQKNFEKKRNGNGTETEREIVTVPTVFFSRSAL
jgi:hypothetical protein